MRKKREIARLRRRLLVWYGAEARQLPWRDTSDPYAIWVSEVMLQQTRVETVLPYYERWMDQYPDVEALALASEEDVLRLWQGLGYYHRARSLLHAAQQLKGRLPVGTGAWSALPGVGAYTAAAIASRVSGEVVAAVDGNARRVVCRLDSISGPPGGKVERRITAAAQVLVSPDEPGDFNQAVMELGALVCTPRQPRCADCPVRADCQGHAQGVAEQLPRKKKRRKVPHKTMVSVVLRHQGAVLLAKRPPSGLLPGLWELPTFEASSDELASSLSESFAAEMGGDVRPGDCLATLRHAYSHLKTTVHLYDGELDGDTIEAGPYERLSWESLEAGTERPLTTVTTRLLSVVDADRES